MITSVVNISTRIFANVSENFLKMRAFKQTEREQITLHVHIHLHKNK